MTTRNAINIELIEAVPAELAYGSAFGPNGRFIRVAPTGSFPFAVADIRVSDTEPILFGRNTDEILALCNMRLAFDAVHNLDNWKGAVDAMISAKDVEIVVSAVEHYTATMATVTVIGGGTFAHVTAPGYWAGPAA